ncbi:MAG: hypothetical protein QOI38_331 [Sphingomonadales bacterium]|nr:hypothetical protein [Sphingomonadales bacterium]
MTAAHCYALFGLSIASELALPGFPEGDGDPDVAARFGAVAAQDRPVAVADDALFLSVPEVGRFRIADGREILIDPEPGASERNLRVYLLGSAMGALLHQRGILPLHANAVAHGERAVAFAGRSGAGKSTLAAWFAGFGREVLCDDVCAIGRDEAGAPLVLPGVPRLRLWSDALARSGRDSMAYDRSFDGQDKYDVPVPPSAPSTPRPLAACYLLDEAQGAPTIERLSPGEAAEALVANTYRGGFVRLLGLTERHFAQCVSLARSVPVYRARRRWGEAFLDEEAERLSRHVGEML